MIIITKYFIEKTDADYEIYNRIWEENKHRMVFLQINLPKLRQIITEITDDKDILAIRFPSEREVDNNFYLKNIRDGNGISYQDKVWLPKEIWIYSMMR
jgi:hypothetical protein